MTRPQAPEIATFGDGCAFRFCASSPAQKFRIRHDRRQHVRVLRGLLEQDNVKEALAYLADYEGSMAKAIQLPLCENFVVGTLPPL